MKSQVTRIDSFIETLQASSMSENQESVVLTGTLASAGGHNYGVCENQNHSDCSGSNMACTNHGVCLDGANYECHNVEPSPTETPDQINP